MRRRAFLAGGLAAVAACAGSSGDQRGDSPSTAPAAAGAARRVVVVGAGLAGLSAALDLTAAGWEVVVLEARERVGGRVHTLRSFGNGLHAEAGGESIDQDHSALLAMAKRFSLAVEQRPADKLETGTVFLGGRRQRTADFITGRGGAVAADYLRAYDALDRMAESESIDPEAPEQARNAERLDAMSLADFHDGLDLLPEARFLVETGDRGEYNAETDEVSLLFALQQSAVGADLDDSGVEAMRLAGGNDRLAAAMADGLGDAVRTGRVVQRIERRPDGVSVQAGNEVHVAAHLVLAVPPPALRGVTFAPALPTAVAAAVAGLDLGAAVKVVTRFDRRFWTADGGSGFTVSDQPFHVAWSPTDSYGSDADPGLLSTFTTGASGRAFAAQSAPARTAEVRRQLLEVYPEGEASITDRTDTVAWPNERFTGGGYAVYAPGQVTTAWRALREPVGRIRFAGEHTEALAGYMESAVRSGQRAAAAIGSPPS